MTALNPTQRLKMAEVLTHPWLKGTKATKNEIRSEFVNRKKEVDEESQKDRDQKRAERAAENGFKKKVTRGDLNSEEDGGDQEEEKAWMDL